jgi:hypothetical protein
MTYYDVANLVTVTKTNMIRRNALWLCKNNCCEITAPSLPQCSCLGSSQCLTESCAEVTGAPKFDYRISQISSHPVLYDRSLSSVARDESRMARDESRMARDEPRMTGDYCRPEESIHRCVRTHSHLYSYIYGLVALLDYIQ